MTPAPESLAEIALLFCREVMGWDDVFIGKLNPIAVEKREQSFGWQNSFAFTDLNFVLAAVQKWADEHSTAIILAYRRQANCPAWAVSINGEEENHDDLCHALMAACVSANRMLGAG